MTKKLIYPQKSHLDSYNGAYTITNWNTNHVVREPEEHPEHGMHNYVFA